MAATPAIDGINFSIEEGEVFGVLGPNGSGKTTLVRLLNGVLTPTSRKAILFGKDVTIEGAYVRARTGVLTETPSLYERLMQRRISPSLAGSMVFLMQISLSGSIRSSRSCILQIGEMKRWADFQKA